MHERHDPRSAPHLVEQRRLPPWVDHVGAAGDLELVAFEDFDTQAVAVHAAKHTNRDLGQLAIVHLLDTEAEQQEVATEFHSWVRNVAYAEGQGPNARAT